MRFLKFLIVVVVTVAITLLCVWLFDCESCESREGCDSGKVHISCESKGNEEDEPEENYDEGPGDEYYVETMSVKVLSEEVSEDAGSAETEDAVTASPAEGETAEIFEALEDEDYGEVPRWVQIAFDVVVIAATVGVIVLVWFLYKKFMKRFGGTARRFG